MTFIVTKQMEKQYMCLTKYGSASAAWTVPVQYRRREQARARSSSAKHEKEGKEKPDNSIEGLKNRYR